MQPRESDIPEFVGDPMIAERMTIRGSVRWAVTDRGRVIVQFADDQDLMMALRILGMSPRLLRKLDDGSTLEFQLPAEPPR
jgi:hypothetical protein